jgi:hypothetical protein
MYPQSLHTHSPAQYNAALASSSAFWASVLRLPNTERDVVVESSDDTNIMEEAENGAERIPPCGDNDDVDVLTMALRIVVVTGAKASTDDVRR